MLEQYIGKRVTIKFFDGDIKTGVLRRNTIGYKPYYLETEDHDIVFCKTHAKRIEVKE